MPVRFPNISRLIWKKELDDSTINPPLQIEEDEKLSRLDFAPIHIKNNQVLETAISHQDLTDPKRGFSINRTQYLKISVLDWLEQKQRTKNPTDNQDPYICKFTFDDATELTTADGLPAISIASDRVMEDLEKGIPENLAHALLFSAFKKSRSEVKEVKSLLVPLLQQGLTTFSTYRAELVESKTMRKLRWRRDA